MALRLKCSRFEFDDVIRHTCQSLRFSARESATFPALFICLFRALRFAILLCFFPLGLTALTPFSFTGPLVFLPTHDLSLAGREESGKNLDWARFLAWTTRTFRSSTHAKFREELLVEEAIPCGLDAAGEGSVGGALLRLMSVMARSASLICSFILCTSAIRLNASNAPEMTVVDGGEDPEGAGICGCSSMGSSTIGSYTPSNENSSAQFWTICTSEAVCCAGGIL